jgi:hypothetical protein
MKRLVLLSLLCLSGCALVDSFLMKYDPNEYALIADIRNSAGQAKGTCDTPDVAKSQAVSIANKTNYFVQYTQYLPHNEPTKKSAVDLNDIAQGLTKQYQGNVSPAFCKIKFGMIEKSAELIQQTVGAKPR